jgi:uncharacterized cofD-like protein
MKKIVVVGGGTGTHTILRGLKKYVPEFSISAIVTMADSGGSTGRLRDEFGQLPVGDVRMALVALADDTGADDDLLRELFMYRFTRGEGLVGHNFGNLLLTALTDIVGNERDAIGVAARLLRVAGDVIPVTTDNVHLQATYSTGDMVVGEHAIDTPAAHLHGAHITNLSLSPRAALNPVAYEALVSADVIIFGPGDLYTSILANCIVTGFKEAIAKSGASIVYVPNLMSRPGQTFGMTATAHVHELAEYSARMPDHVLVNTTPLPESLVLRYQAEGTHPIEVDFGAVPYQVHASDLLATESVITKAGDTLVRSLIRHDSHKVAALVHSIFS